MLFRSRVRQVSPRPATWDAVNAADAVVRNYASPENAKVDALRTIAREWDALSPEEVRDLATEALEASGLGPPVLF